ncbi:MAG: hypothetical protein HKO81_04335 [Flavobacteriaceae bacterium]|nr:hypothetical protein [Bacteroidia bacterium]NNL15853.1 hypothetical protein [Flavobacteriaceae bacterium]
MSDKKHIDRIFQEKLKDIEFEPTNAVWNKISKELTKNKEPKKVIPLWWKLAGVAAVLILLLTVGNLIFNNSDSNENIPVIVKSDISENEKKDAAITGIDVDKTNKPSKVTKPETTKSKNEIVKSKILTNNNSIADTPVKGVSDKNQNAGNFSDETKRSKLATDTKNSVLESNDPNSYASNKDNSSLIKDPNRMVEKTIKTVNASDDALVMTDEKMEKSNKITDKANLDLSKNLKEIIEEPIQKVIPSDEALVLNEDKTEPIKKDLEDISNVESKDPSIIEKEKIPLTEEVIVNNEDINEEEKENINRWQVYPNIAPVYFNSLGKGSSLDGQFNNNPKTGELNTSYGVNVGYAVNDKITLKTGFNALAVSYDTDNVILYQNIGASQLSPAFRNIKMDNNSEVTMISASSVNAQQVNSVLGANSNAAISQRLDFFEVPLELDYNIINKKMGLNLSGGFSTFILRNNEVVSEFDGFNTYIGEATNINNISYSLNFGLGFNFPLSQRMSFNVDPKFKYQINTFKNTSGNFRPYIIGLYTGLNYKF